MNDAKFTDGLGKIAKFLIIELVARLEGIRLYLIDFYLEDVIAIGYFFRSMFPPAFLDEAAGE